tara:strand:- start:259 stop:528 length:270 start_codon:yes stop_codon:yes gene_type:complete
MITFQISAKYFWGYRTKIDIDEYNTTNEIIKKVIENCKDFFKKNNLLSLVDLLESSTDNYHIHDYKLEDLKLLNKLDSSEIVYICDHCH